MTGEILLKIQEGTQFKDVDQTRPKKQHREIIVVIRATKKRKYIEDCWDIEELEAKYIYNEFIRRKEKT